VAGVQLTFEGVVGFGAQDAEDAAHFFEHVLGLELAGEEGNLRFYGLGDGTAAAVDISGATAGTPPYLLFSTDDVTAAAEYFLERGCTVGELPWASGSGFIARSPEGHTVCVIAATESADA
jgi:catechol 2,3-dioxygenase-like lactoylglutathione lyase family enzyme